MRLIDKLEQILGRTIEIGEPLGEILEDMSKMDWNVGEIGDKISVENKGQEF